MKKTLHVLLILLLIIGCFFGLTFVIYMFNLDMKAAAKLYDWIQPIYDKRKRNVGI